MLSTAIAAIVTIVSIGLLPHKSAALDDPSPHHHPDTVNQHNLITSADGSQGGTKGAVASEHKICSQIGIDLLRRGGNAADALVGTVFCVGVVAPYHSGIGGGSFSLVRKPHAQRRRQRSDDLDDFEFLDYREVAPNAAHKDMFEGREHQSLTGALSVAVPGEVRGLAHLHTKYGNLSWYTVLQGAVHLARYGFPVHQALYDSMVGQSARRPFLRDPSWAVDFAPQGSLLKVGETITLKRFADTLSKIQQDPEAFYKGEIAKSIVRTVQEGGGIMTLADLAKYTVETRRPLSIDHHDHRIVSVGAPGSGAVTLSTLKIIGGYNDTANNPNLNTSYHRLMEAFRFAYSQRAHLGDPDHISNMDKFQAMMLNDSTTAHIRSRITNQTHQADYYNPSHLEILSDGGTSHIAAADASGLSISTTSTINHIFGSLVRDASTGVILNNEMNDFSIPSQPNNLFGYVPSPENYIAPRKRPLSSMSPVIVEKRNANHNASSHASTNRYSLALLAGAAGGSRIISAVTQVLWHELDHPDPHPHPHAHPDALNAVLRSDTTDNTEKPAIPIRESLKSVLARPRFHDQVIPYTADFEQAFNETSLLAGVISDMVRRGHNVTVDELPAGIVTAIRLRVDHWGQRKNRRNGGSDDDDDGDDDDRNKGWFEAAADPRLVDGAGLTF